MLKRCATCKEDKPRKEFYINRAKPDGRQYSCKDCQKTYHNDTWYESHRQHRIQQVKERKARVVRENYKKIFMEYYIHGCVYCVDRGRCGARVYLTVCTVYSCSSFFFLFLPCPEY